VREAIGSVRLVVALVVGWRTVGRTVGGPTVVVVAAVVGGWRTSDSEAGLAELSAVA
jgi:hypothetical protein